MARVLFTWELGRGSGHLLSMLPLAKGLAARGHDVFVAVKNVLRASAVFEGVHVALLQAPIGLEAPTLYRSPANHAQIIANLGFGDDRDLHALTAAWRNLYCLIRPDLIVFDHSPAAMLAARGTPAKRLVIGTGFCCPPDISPFPVLPTDFPADAHDSVRVIEQEILDRVNRLLHRCRQPSLERLAQLYSQVDETFLNTFPELDHYPVRPDTRYWGPVHESGGATPDWPAGSGTRVYAYLKPFPALPQLLKTLNDRRLPTLVYADKIDEDVQRQFSSETLRFEKRRLDLQLVGRQCDLAIVNATHGTTSTLLLHGRPLLLVPLHLEQGLTGTAVRRLGAGEMVRHDSGAEADIHRKLDAMLAKRHYGEAARRFANKYASFDAAQQRHEMLLRTEALLHS
jgi:hypothetical protein